MKWVRLSLVLLVLAQLAGPWGWHIAVGDEITRQGVLVPYEITGPEGWLYQVEPHQYVLGVFRPEEDDLYPYISLTMAGGDFQTMQRATGSYQFTPEQLVERNLYERPGARLLSSRWLKDDGEAADFLLAEFIWSSELGDIQVIKAFHPFGDSVLVVTAASLADDYAEYEPAFHKAVMSVRIKPHPNAEEKKKPEKATGGDEWLYDD